MESPVVPGAFTCCGIRIDAYDLGAATDVLIEGRGTGAVHLCNAYTLSLARRDPAYAEVLNRGDLNLPDGMPLVWVARRTGLDMPGRVYGPDLMAATMDRGRSFGLRHYLYGSRPEVLKALATRLIERYPGTRLVGVEAPPFRDQTPAEEDALIDRVRMAEPDIMWVGLGTPRQDVFVDRFRNRLDATLVAVGAAFDFHAGTLRQAPRWMQDRGLEWAFRLATEPKRLWRRYLVGNTRFLVGVVRDGVEVVATPAPARLAAVEHDDCLTMGGTA